jgi:hypothetical protein
MASEFSNETGFKVGGPGRLRIEAVARLILRLSRGNFRG